MGQDCVNPAVPPKLMKTHPLISVLSYGVYCNGYFPSTATRKTLSVALISPFTKHLVAVFPP